LRLSFAADRFDIAAQYMSVCFSIFETEGCLIATLRRKIDVFANGDTEGGF
jgi:hypothetical protein